MIEREFIKDRFKGKVAIVTGGSSGIGKAIAEELCREGASVCYTGISDTGYGVESEFAAKDYDTLFCKGDMMDDAFCKSVVDKTVDKWGKLNFLVNNAFSFTAKGMDATTEDWMRSMFVGPVGYARMVQYSAPHMRKEAGAAVVNMSSISAHIAQIHRWTYNAAKGAVQQLTKCQALDLSPLGIRVNSVSPAWVWTREVDKSAQVAGGGREKWEPIWGQYHLLRRCAEPVECAGPVLFLLSKDASFITGTDLAIDGGYLAVGPEGLGQTTVNAGSQ